MLFDEVEYVWPKLGYPPLVTPFSQYVKNVALMNVMSLLKGEGRWTQIDRFTWDMILGKSGKLPGPLDPEIEALAQEKGLEFTDADPQSYFPDQLDEYRKEMDENGWDYGEDDEELFELAMHDRQYRDYKSGVAKERFLADLQRAKDAALSKTGLDEDAIRRMKRAKAQPVTAPERGQVVWEVAVDGPSQAPAPGRVFKQGETFCYIATTYGTHEPVPAPFEGVIVEVCVRQGDQAQRGAVLAYLERAN
jgi:pyruvate carboxylase subunit B